MGKRMELGHNCAMLLLHFSHLSDSVMYFRQEMQNLLRPFWTWTLFSGEGWLGPLGTHRTVQRFLDSHECAPIEMEKTKVFPKTVPNPHELCTETHVRSPVQSIPEWHIEPVFLSSRSLCFEGHIQAWFVPSKANLEQEKCLAKKKSHAIKRQAGQSNIATLSHATWQTPSSFLRWKSCLQQILLFCLSLAQTVWKLGNTPPRHKLRLLVRMPPRNYHCVTILPPYWSICGLTFSQQRKKVMHHNFEQMQDRLIYSADNWSPTHSTWLWFEKKTTSSSVAFCRRVVSPSVSENRWNTWVTLQPGKIPRKMEIRIQHAVQHRLNKCPYPEDNVK